MNKVTKLFNLGFYNWFLIFLIFLNITPWLAPIFAHFGWKWPAKIIYFVYSFTCHQFHWRSLHIYDHQCAWCTRDTFIWAAILVVALIVKFHKTKGLHWYQVLPFVIPIALDGGIQTVATVFGFNDEEPFYMSTNLMRMMTGGIFGTGLAMWMIPLLKELTDNEQHAH